MQLYQVSYLANEPVWGDVRIMADDPDEASHLAVKEIEQMYPEYDHVEVESIQEIGIVRGGSRN